MLWLIFGHGSTSIDNIPSPSEVDEDSFIPSLQATPRFYLAAVEKLYITAKTIGCFNHRVVTLIAVKLKEQWFCYLTAVIRSGSGLGRRLDGVDIIIGCSLITFFQNDAGQ